jgi:hypothetical protein
MVIIDDPKKEAELEAKFRNAGPLDFKIKELEEAIQKAEQNIKIFSDQVQSQIMLKAQLEAELASFKAKKEKEAK